MGALLRTDPADTSPHLDQVARAFADMVDLKSPFTHGHSAAVAELAEAAAADLGLAQNEVVSVRRAGFCTTLVGPVFRTASGTSQAR